MDGRAALETVNYTRELAHALSVQLFSRSSYAFCLRSTLRRFPASRNAAVDDGAYIGSVVFGRYENFRNVGGRFGRYLMQERDASSEKNRVCYTCHVQSSMKLSI